MTYPPGTIVHRADPELNQARYEVIRHHGDRVRVRPVGGGREIEVPAVLIIEEEGCSTIE